jgi:hypothetical protein
MCDLLLLGNYLLQSLTPCEYIGSHMKRNWSSVSLSAFSGNSAHGELHLLHFPCGNPRRIKALYCVEHPAIGASAAALKPEQAGLCQRSGRVP